MTSGAMAILSTPFRHLWRHRVLTCELAKREIKDRYADQMFGSIWAFTQPILLVTLYVFIFKYVFRVGVLSGSDDNYTVFLLAGMLPWLAFQDSLNKTTNVLVANAQLVKQIVFPVEILPVKTIMASFLNQIVATSLLIVYIGLTTGVLSPLFLLLPVLWVFQAFAMAGVGFVLASVGAYFRDLRDIVAMFGVIGLYTMPICYTPELLPAKIRFILYLNPFSYMVWCYQDVCYSGAILHPFAWGLFLSGAVGVFYFGFFAFQKVKLFFGNVL